MAIEEKDLTSLSLDELIGNLKVHEMIIKKDSEIVKAKGERKSLALKVWGGGGEGGGGGEKESSEKSVQPSRSEEEEYAMAVRELPEVLYKNRGSWSDSVKEDDDKDQSETCLVAQASSETKAHNSEITKDGKVISRCIRKKGLYVMKLGNKPKDQICLATIDENSTLWHRRLGHANMRLRQSLASKKLVRNLPKLKFDQHFCDACKIGKQAHASHKAKNIVSATRWLELLHMDLFGPSVVRSYGGNRYTLVIVDDYSRKVEESLNVTFNETPSPSKTSPLVDDNLDEEEEIKVTKKKNLENDIEDETLEIDEIVNISKNHPLENNVNEALTDDSWIVTMQEELNQFITNDVWELVPQPRNMTIIETKWVFRNKLDENGIVSRNKARLVAQGYNQQEGIDYDETYAPVARVESIRILLAYACALDFKLFQMDVNSAFLNGFINEEIYVAQPQGFIDFVNRIMFINLRKLYTVLNKHPKLGMID
ncbi:retrovirus-related pol polyprotein from transposon TNT 1-94 [Tanacetum coccineum]